MDGIRPAELDARLEDDEDVFLLDIRREADFEADHIDGSFNAPVYDDIDAEGDALEPYLDSIPADALVVAICPVGVTASDAAVALRDRGYDAVSLDGGFRLWRKYESDSLEYRVRSWLRSLVS